MRTLATIAVVLGALSLAGRSDARSPNFCRLTAGAALRACQAGARSDGALTMGKCINRPDATGRKTCARQAAVDTKDARASCRDEHDVRQAACERLGPAPYAPAIDPANFVATVDNPFFPLTPGTTFVYEGQTSQGLEHDEFFVTHNTRVILGVTCIEVHDTVRTNGELTEDTLDWFAQDREGNVWYFGENTMELAGGLPTTLEGTFTGGVDGAQPGMVMEAHPAIGDFYRQEFDLGDAEDFAEVISLSEPVTVPAGSFAHCLETKETTPLEPDLVENKFYAAGVGNLLTVDATTGERSELVAITTE